MLSERRTNRGDVEQGQSRPKVVPIRAGPGKRTGNGNHQVNIIIIILLYVLKYLNYVLLIVLFF